MTTDEPEPAPEHLSSPRGAPLTALGWADVRRRVAEAGDFLLATTDPDGRPHVVPVLGVWLEGGLFRHLPAVPKSPQPRAQRRVRGHGARA